MRLYQLPLDLGGVDNFGNILQAKMKSVSTAVGFRWCENMCCRILGAEWKAFQLPFDLGGVDVLYIYISIWAEKKSVSTAVWFRWCGFSYSFGQVRRVFQLPFELECAALQPCIGSVVKWINSSLCVIILVLRWVVLDSHIIFYGSCYFLSIRILVKLSFYGSCYF